MLNASLALIVASQAVLGPMCPPGTNAAFGEAVLGVERHLEKGAFEEARKALAMLPKKKATMFWDDSAVPQELRREYLRARDSAITQVSPLVQVSQTKEKNADIRVSFTKELPPNVESSRPAGAVHMFGIPPEDPRVETVISLSRGGLPNGTELNDVHNEVGYALMSYLGVARAPLLGSLSSRTDGPSPSAYGLGNQDRAVANEILAIVDKLHKAVEAKERLIPTEPRAILQPGKIEIEPVIQGEMIKFNMLLSNSGNAPLAARLKPDCGCVFVGTVPVIPAGGSAKVDGYIDTTLWAGPLDRHIVMYTNDFEEPIRHIPVKTNIIPRYRFLMPEPTMMLDPDKTTVATIYLALAENANIVPGAVKLDGLKGEIEEKPWSGTMADPQLGEGPKPRKGYAYKITIPPTSFPGRMFATLSVQTSNERFPIIKHSFGAQKGIVALPDQVYLGEISNAPLRASFIVTRPEKPFKILKVVADTSNLTATSVSIKPWEHKVTVQYDGKADVGRLKGTIEVHTDDPKQKVVRVPLSGVIR